MTHTIQDLFYGTTHYLQVVNWLLESSQRNVLSRRDGMNSLLDLDVTLVPETPINSGRNSALLAKMDI